MRQYDIIGGSGFVGLRLCNRLISNKIKFSILDKIPNNKYFKKTKITDVRSIDNLRAHITSGSVLINLAAEHKDDIYPPSLYEQVNVDGANNICKVAKEKNISKIIFTSSVAVYGFSPIGTDENSQTQPFNDYGKTKLLAEEIFKSWQKEEPYKRTLVIIRPTVVFGENNRGNVYNLMRQIALNKFLIVGNGMNRKSIAYVENLAAFIEYSTSFDIGIHLYNYIDKPDYKMIDLVKKIKVNLGKTDRVTVKIPFTIAYLLGKCFDIISILSGKKFSISAIRVKKFCSNSVFNSAIFKTDFIPPVSLDRALSRTIKHEFIEKN